MRYNFTNWFSSILLVLLVSGCSQETVQEQHAKAIQQIAGNVDHVAQITDRDTNGTIESMRIDFQYDGAGHRVSNNVVDENERLLATELFSYDSRGRLTERRFLVGGTDLKWKWSEFEYDAEGRPTRNDIQNANGKQIGWNVWSYKNGQLVRRERFNSDGTIRFYFADLKYEGERYSQWTKYDAAGTKVATKVWRYDQ